MSANARAHATLADLRDRDSARAERRGTPDGEMLWDGQSHTADMAVWEVEHRIRSVVIGRGMRPGKAIRRVFPDATAAEVQALAGLWSDGAFRVDMDADHALFVRAYSSVRSCMAGQGEACWAAYNPIGVKLAVVVGPDRERYEPTARALHYAGKYNAAYGVDSYALGVFLRLIAGIGFSQRWLDGAAHLCVVTENVRSTRTIVLAERRLEKAVRAADLTPEICLTYETDTSPNYPGTVFLYTRRVTRDVVRFETVETFRPFIDARYVDRCA